MRTFKTKQLPYMFLVNSSKKEKRATYPFVAISSKEDFAEKLLKEIAKNVTQRKNYITLFFSWENEEVKVTSNVSYDATGKAIISDMEVSSRESIEVVYPTKEIILDYLLLRAVKFPEYSISFAKRKCLFKRDADNYSYLWYNFKKKGVSINHLM